MIRKMMMLQFAVSGLAFAQAPSAISPLEKAPLIGPSHAMSCPGGTSQFGGPQSRFGAYGCMKKAADGSRIVHGPMVSFDNNGHVVEVGQMDESHRTGQWKFFDASGNLIGVTNFQNGDYHGLRVEFHPNGQMKFEENWLNGKRQGPQKTFDTAGLATVTTFRDDRMVSK